MTVIRANGNHHYYLSKYLLVYCYKLILLDVFCNKKYNENIIGKLPINMTYGRHTVAVQLPLSLQCITLHITLTTKTLFDSSYIPICFHKRL